MKSYFVIKKKGFFTLPIDVTDAVFIAVTPVSALPFVSFHYRQKPGNICYSYE